MFNSIDSISEVLQDTFLADHKMYPFEIQQSEHLAFGLEVNWARGLDAWKLMRSLLPITGRYPVLVMDSISDDYAPDTWFDRQAYEEEAAEGLIQSTAADTIIAEAETVDRATFLERFQDEIAEDVESDYLWNDLICVLEEVAEELGKGPSEAEIRKLLDDGVVRSPFELEKWLFNWELQNVETHRPTMDTPIYGDLWDVYGWGGEMEPRTVSLFLLPTQHSWETLAYWPWSGSSTIGTTVVMSFLKAWNQQYGAELVWNCGMTLRLKISQKPTVTDEAFQLACEHYSLAPYTLDAPGVLLRRHAEDLFVFDGWELIEGH